MKNILAFLIVGLGFLCSCESRDGDWDSMVWESNDVSNINKNKNIEVPQAGNTYVFTCKNYKNFLGICNPRKWETNWRYPTIYRLQKI